MKLFTKILLFLNLCVFNDFFCAEIYEHELNTSVSAPCRALHWSLIMQTFKIDQIEHYFNCKDCKTRAFHSLVYFLDKFNFEKVKIIAEEFIKKGADINALNCKIEFPIKVAAKSGNINLVKLYISLGADVNIVFGDHVLTVLIKRLYENVYEPIYEKLSESNAYQDTIKNIKMIKFLLDVGANPNNQNPLRRVLSRYFTACDSLKKDFLEVIYLLLIYGADPNFETDESLMISNFFDCAREFPEINEVYEKARKYLEEQEQSQMYVEDRNRHTQIVLSKKKFPQDVINIINEY